VFQLSYNVLQEHGSVFHLVFFFLILQAFVCIAYIVLAIAGSFNYGINSLIYLLFSLYWVVEVLSNILAMTVSSLAVFWATGGNVVHPKNPVRAFFILSITYAFGLVALAFMIAALLKIIRLIAGKIAGQKCGNANVISRTPNFYCLCFLGKLENMIQCFDVWAYAYIAMYQDDLCTSA